MNKRLKNKLDELNEFGVSTEICNKLANFIEEAQDSELLLISPYSLAAEWRVEKQELLQGFLYGSKIGLFDLEWSIKCPSCSISTDKKSTLKDLSSKSHCEHCMLDVDAGFDDAVEVVFNINHNIRKTKHFTTEQILMPRMEMLETITIDCESGKNSEISLDLKHGTYYMTNHELNTGAPLQIEDSSENSSNIIEYNFENDALCRVDFKVYNSGQKTIILNNNSNIDVSFSFSRMKFIPWVSGADVITNQFFRDYFTTELISADESFGIKNMVFVFTDIKGSTDLYEKRGDSKAYYLVKEHFKIMTEIVNSHNGAIVKTIGDAIMATFLSSEDGVDAVFEMHKKFDEFNAKEKTRDDIIVKIGLHRGSCIAVTSNDRLDYFGRTVNIAARVQGLSGGGDIMISDSLYQELNIEQMICCKSEWTSRPIEATLKGIEGKFKVKHFYRA